MVISLPKLCVCAPMCMYATSTAITEWAGRKGYGRPGPIDLIFSLPTDPLPLINRGAVQQCNPLFRRG